MAIININTDAVVAYTNKLEKLHRSDLPIAIRNALTKAALLTKKESLLKITRETFVNRNKTFFKAKSKFLPAKGFNIDGMKATIGMSDLRISSNDHAVRNLEKQEHGGSIGGRSFIPTDDARVGKSRTKNVAPRNRLNKIGIKNVLRVGRSVGKNRDQRFIKTVLLAKRKFGARAYVLTRKILFRVDSVSTGGRLKFKITRLYSFKRSRSVRVKPTNFMLRSAKIQGNKMDILYKREAEKRIKKARL